MREVWRLGGAGIIFAVSLLPWDDLMMIWVPFFCRARLRFNGSWMTCFDFAPPPPPMPYYWHHHFHMRPLLQNIQDQILFCVSLRRGGWVVWNRRLSKLSFHVLFLWYVTEGWGVVPSRLTNMQRLSSHGWNNLYWGMFGSQGRIIFQSIPLVSCTTKWKWALPKNTKGKSSLVDRRQKWYESSTWPVWARWSALAGAQNSSHILFLTQRLHHRCIWWNAHWFHYVSWVCRRRLRLLPKQRWRINALVRQQPTTTEAFSVLEECRNCCTLMLLWPVDLLKVTCSKVKGR